MARSNKIFDLAFAFDENYLLPFYVLLTSIFENNNKHIFRIHVIATGIRTEKKNQIRDYIGHFKNEIIFYEIDKEFIRKFAVSNESRYPISVYYRLFFPYLISKSIDKILYLDIDTIVIGKLAPLFGLRLTGRPIGVAQDDEYLRPDLGINEKGKYFNTGVMLINLESWRRLDLTQKAIQFLTQYPEKAKYHDQDALNVILKDNWHKLNVKYNLTYQNLPNIWFRNSGFHYFISKRSLPLILREEFDKYLKEIIVIHFNHKFKPWIIGSYHPLKYLYNHYIIKIPEYPFGNVLIAKNFNFQFAYCIIKLFSLERNDLQTRIYLAISLHIHWFKFMVSDMNEGINLKILKEYYDNSNLTKDEDYKRYDEEFEKNKEILYNIFSENIIGDNSLNSELYVILSKWKSICKKEIIRLNKTNGKNNITTIPELINIQFGIYDKPRSLVLHFIFRIFKNSEVI